MNASPWNKTPWGLLGAVAVVIAVEAVVARFDLDLTRPGNLDWRQASRATVTRTAGRDVLCFGTSMINQGVFPEVIERKSGLRAQNMGVYAGRAAFSYYFLRRALAAGARPSAVLVDFHPAFLKSGYEVHNGWSDLLGLRECAEVAWTLKDSRFFTSAMLDKGFPSIYHRLDIRGWALAAVRGKPASLRWVNSIYLRNRRRNKGSFVNRPCPEYHGEVTSGYQQILVDKRFGCLPEEEAYIRRFLDLAGDHGIRVYWLVMPLAPALQERREANGVDAEYTRFVRSFRGYANLVVLDGRRSGYDASVFMDACHLDPQGGLALSGDVADILRRERCGKSGAGYGRWVDLPAYRPRPFDVPLEGVMESIAILGLNNALLR